ncbi:hypothetical protein [Staphylococcus warneri]|uniref:Uncharacterized protein n=1 Tax=Staphylococcus warneri TaxID=1292 RepID=A0AB36BK20_STAWA|nr:hypothetical protein [Staphylococcus warneri]NBH31620.1 hypothetical protein [Staphylococcus warneri]
MTSLIKRAIPTEDKPQKYLRNNKEDISITPWEAKQLFPDTITSGRAFKCKCGAPITCRAISKDSNIAPVFINQVTKENKHASWCDYHPRNIEKANAESNKHKKKHKNKNDGEFKSTLTSNGFPTEDKKGKAIAENEYTDGNSSMDTVTKAVGEPSDIRHTKYNLKTVEEHVLQYLDDKYLQIYTANGDRISIHEMFQPIQKNKVRNKCKYPRIYYGKAYINPSQNNEDILQIKFHEKIKFQGVEKRPYFKVEKTYLRKNYEDIYDAYMEKQTSQFDVYITLPFVVGSFKNKANEKKVDYITFQSYKSDGQHIKADSKELKANMYIC